MADMLNIRKDIQYVHSHVSLSQIPSILFEIRYCFHKLAWDLKCTMDAYCSCTVNGWVDGWLDGLSALQHEMQLWHIDSWASNTWHINLPLAIICSVPRTWSCPSFDPLPSYSTFLTFPKHSHFSWLWTPWTFKSGVQNTCLFIITSRKQPVFICPEFIGLSCSLWYYY